MNDLKIKYDGRYCGVVGKNNAVVVPFIYDEILRTFSSGLINVCKNDKWGCLDLDGNVVIPIEYDWIAPFGKDVLSSSNVRKKGKWGVLNRSGEEKIPCVYDEEIVFKDNCAIVSKNGKMGIINKKGECVIPCCYSYLKPFVNSSKLFKVAENNKSGIVDILGGIIVPIIYDEIGNLYDDVVVVKRNGFYGLINLVGEEIIPCEYDKIDKFRPKEGLSSNSEIYYYDNDDKSGVFSVLKGRKWRYILANNESRNNHNYDWIAGMFPPYNYVVKTGKKYGLINQRGEEVVPIEYTSIFGIYGYFVLETKRKKGVCNGDGELLIPISCKDIQIISEKSAIVENTQGGFLFFFDGKEPIGYEAIFPFGGKYCKVYENGKCGVVNDAGEIIIPLIYDQIEYHKKNRIYVIKGNKVGIIDLSGEEIVPIKYEMGETIEVKSIGEGNDIGERKLYYKGPLIIPSFYGDGMIIRFNGKYGVINSKGVELIPFEYNWIEFFCGLFIVRKKNRVGALDIHNQVIVSIEYEEIVSSGNFIINRKDDGVLLLVKKNCGWIILDIMGRMISPNIYDEIDRNGFSFMRLAVCRDGKWGFIDKKGHEVIKCIYDEVVGFYDDTHCKVKLNGEEFWINANGIRVQNCPFDDIQ